MRLSTSFDFHGLFCKIIKINVYVETKRALFFCLFLYTMGVGAVWGPITRLLTTFYRQSLKICYFSPFLVLFSPDTPLHDIICNRRTPRPQASVKPLRQRRPGLMTRSEKWRETFLKCPLHTPSLNPSTPRKWSEATPSRFFFTTFASYIKR